jgi:pilus assembly protein CpaB
LQQRGGGPLPDMRTVVVAASDISVGHRLQEKDLRVVQLPADSIPPGSFRRVRDVIGRGAVLPIAQGEFMIAGKNLASENAGAGLPSMIPSGMRAVTVRVGDSSVGSFITPGTRVDVLVTGNAGAGETQTITVLKNIAVLANGTRLDRSGYSPDSQNSPVITLLVSPDDAEKLALAMAKGRIELALRNPLDTEQEDIAAAKVNALFPDQKLATPAPQRRVKPKPVPVVLAPAGPSWYPVEVIKGDKRDVTKLSE